MSSEPGLPSSAPEWVAELAQGELSPAQRAALTDWLRESPTHVRELLQLTLIHQDLAALSIGPEQIEAWVPEARAAAQAPTPLLIRARERAKSWLPRQSSRIHEDGHRQKRWASVAGGVLAVAGFSAYLVWQSGRYATHVGEQRVVTLADGSVFSLNTDSELRVRYSSKRRAIELIKGEAYFRVSHDASRPFVVTAQNATVKAVGTQFDVRIASQDTIVSVVDGAVEVRSAALANPKVDSVPADSAIQVRKGQEIHIRRMIAADASSSSPIVLAERTTALGSAAWTQGRVEFDATPLVDVLSEFQRYGDLHVQIDDEALRQLKLTGSFDAHDPQAALDYVGTLPGIVVEKTGPRTYIVRRR
jgi:transmembrane sensor